MVRLGAHAADAVDEQGHFLNRATDTEAFEAAQLRDLEIGIGDFAICIEENFNLAVPFQAGNGINRDALHDLPPKVLASQSNHLSRLTVKHVVEI